MSDTARLTFTVPKPPGDGRAISVWFFGEKVEAVMWIARALRAAGSLQVRVEVEGYSEVPLDTPPVDGIVLPVPPVARP